MDLCLHPIGQVRSHLTDPLTSGYTSERGAPQAVLALNEDQAPRLYGLAEGDPIVVLTYLHLADRQAVQVHPRRDPSQPVKGVFATRSPNRPNPIGLHATRITRLEGRFLTVDHLEAVDGTPILDIKPDTSALREAGLAPGVTRRDFDLLSESGKRLWRAGLVSGFNSNLSLRREGVALVTTSGSAKGFLADADVVAVDVATGACMGPGRASSESKVHLEVYRHQPLARAVAHCHPPHLLALSLKVQAGELLGLPLFEAEFFRAMFTCVDAFAPGTPELGQAVGQAAADTPRGRGARLVFMRNHGLVAWAEDMNQACALAEEAENLARIQLLSL